MSSQTDRSRYEVTEVAQACLRESPYLSVKSLSCQYDRGVLVLRGRLPSFYLKQLAQEAVADLEGVSEVVNKTEVVVPSLT
jgi:osmotically-inducible protein OsmY